MTVAAYAEQARHLGARASLRDLILCDCRCDGSYADGAEPEDRERLRDAATRWFYHRILKTLYWGVHWKGRHILHVHTAGRLPYLPQCPKCRRRQAARR